MHILTDNRQTRSLLSLQLRELGYNPRFYSETAELTRNLEEKGDEQQILVDVAFDDAELTNRTLSSCGSEAKLIGFAIDQDFDVDDPVASSFPNFLVLSRHAERTRQRLRSILRPDASVTKARLPLARSFAKSTKPKFKSPTRARQEARKTTKFISRYLTCESAAMKAFGSELSDGVKTENLIVLKGSEDSEFELTAREINYLNNGDQNPIYTLEDVGDDQTAILKHIEQLARDRECIATIYFGSFDTLNEDSAILLGLFKKHLDSLENSHARIVVAIPDGIEEWIGDSVNIHLRTLNTVAPSYRIPSMSEREEDIVTIANTTLSNLRMAHPFLSVQSFTFDAIAYLTNNCANYSYGSLLRDLRNAIALVKKHRITVEDIKNLTGGATCDAHFLESMADESYFPQQNI